MYSTARWVEISWAESAMINFDALRKRLLKFRRKGDRRSPPSSVPLKTKEDDELSSPEAKAKPALNPPKQDSEMGEIAPTSKNRTTEPQYYSRAFQNMVDDDDDLVGLLAYAYYKASVREDARSGSPSDGRERNPNKAQVSAYRSHAERELSDVARRAILEATPDIEQTATANAIISNRTEIIAHITRRTGFWSAFGTNILAWIATLFVAGLVLFLAGRPSIDQIAPAILNDRLSENKVSEKIDPSPAASDEARE